MFSGILDKMKESLQSGKQDLSELNADLNNTIKFKTRVEIKSLRDVNHFYDLLQVSLL